MTAVSIMPSEGGGLLALRINSLATTNAQVVKAAGGQFFGLQGRNNAATSIWLKFYNKATAPVVGTDIPVDIFPLNAGGIGNIINQLGVGMYPLGIAMAITLLPADSDTTAVAAGDFIGSIYYK